MTDGMNWIDVGSARIWALNDGEIPGPTSDPGAGGPATIPVNAFLVRSRDRLILVDSGFGEKWLADEPDLRRPSGSIVDGLRRVGFGPDDIDVVVNTHLHVDHAGGDTEYGASGELAAAFPRAEYVIQTAEWAFAGAPPLAWSHLFRRPDFWPLRELDRLRLIEDPYDITDEVRCQAAPGHTPGHQVVRVESGGEAALLTGDAVPSDAFVQRPADESNLDVDPKVAAETRRALTDWARSHGAWLGLGHAGSSLRPVAEIDGRGWPEKAPT